ncbi:hypothetical protein Q1695_013974 [Nippostrongylus brasiliensis]|nr:hypothetical protein Q1695_013974 [Nippostrongylus brasiliensis]
MADLDAELALVSFISHLALVAKSSEIWFSFESEISSLVADPAPPTKKKKKAVVTVEEPKEATNGPELAPSGAPTTTQPSVTTAAPQMPPVMAAAPIMQTVQTPAVMAQFLPRVGALPGVAGVSILPPPVPPPIFVSNPSFRPPPGFPPMPMPNLFLPHQLRQPPARQSATIESAPKIYSAEASANTTTAGQTSTAPVTFALASDIEAMEKKNEHPSAPSSMRSRDKQPMKSRKYLRAGGGQVWEDSSLAEWDKNDFRIFCGDLGNEVSDELLAKAFRKYPSFLKAKVVRDSRSNKSKGYGFVSFSESDDYVRAMREMDGKYVGNRPIKLRKSNWKDRNLEVVKKKQKQKAKLGLWG